MKKVCIMMLSLLICCSCAKNNKSIKSKVKEKDFFDAHKIEENVEKEKPTPPAPPAEKQMVIYHSTVWYDSINGWNTFIRVTPPINIDFLRSTAGTISEIESKNKCLMLRFETAKEIMFIHSFKCKNPECVYVR